MVNTNFLTPAVVILENCNIFFLLMLLQCGEVLADDFLALISPLLCDGFIQISVVVIYSLIVVVDVVDVDVVDIYTLHLLLQV